MNPKRKRGICHWRTFFLGAILTVVENQLFFFIVRAHTFKFLCQRCPLHAGLYRIRHWCSFAKQQITIRIAVEGESKEDPESCRRTFP